MLKMLFFVISKFVKEMVVKLIIVVRLNHQLLCRSFLNAFN